MGKELWLLLLWVSPCKKLLICNIKVRQSAMELILRVSSIKRCLIVRDSNVSRERGGTYFEASRRKNRPQQCRAWCATGSLHEGEGWQIRLEKKVNANYIEPGWRIWLVDLLKQCVCCVPSRVQLCDPMDSSSPGSPVHEIFQARILEWVAISFSL